MPLTTFNNSNWDDKDLRTHPSLLIAERGFFPSVTHVLTNCNDPSFSWRLFKDIYPDSKSLICKTTGEVVFSPVTNKSTLLTRFSTEYISICMVLAWAVLYSHFTYAKCLEPTGKLSLCVLETEQSASGTVISADSELFVIQVVFEVLSKIHHRSKFFSCHTMLALCFGLGETGIYYLSFIFRDKQLNVFRINSCLKSGIANTPELYITSLWDQGRHPDILVSMPLHYSCFWALSMVLIFQQNRNEILVITKRDQGTIALHCHYMVQVTL